ncbi:MAG: SprT family zinc-dependent metalloprotease [Lachnospiraceae bacterium]|nr:SprT family zinc-dependent metalloprotease [Lachnospiraceae bacterium]
MKSRRRDLEEQTFACGGLRKKELQVGEYRVRVTRKRMKNLYLRVKETGDIVEVSAPLSVTDREIEQFVMGRTDWIAGAKRRLEERLREEEEKPVLVPFQEREMRRALKKEIEELLAYWEPCMGVKSEGFTVKKMKTRWGSCNVKTHHLNFNFSLAQVPRPYVEYVVVHELTHLLEPSHNRRFWDLMEQYLPGSRQLRRELNEYRIG